MKNKFEMQIAKQNLLNECSKQDPEAVFKQLDSRFSGLTTEQAEVKLKTFGTNSITTKSFVWYKKLFRCIVNPFIVVLLAILIFHVVNYYLPGGDIGDAVTSIIVGIMITLSVTITYFQDYRSFKSADRLKSMVSNTTSVLRDYQNSITSYTVAEIAQLRNKTTEIDITKLVVGDVIFLSAGDVVPADIRILHASDLFVNQATLTGESDLVEKFAINHNKNNRNILQTDNLAFMGTSINAGSCIAMVIATGKNTYLGNIANALGSKMPRHAFEIGIRKITFLLLTFVVILAPIVFLANYFVPGKNTSLTEAILYAAAAVVALTPEMLPMIVSANLARGAVKMSQKKVIIKNLPTMQSFGEMDILCTDKTGTLTTNEIELVEHLDINGNENQEVLAKAYLNSFYQTGLKNIIDITVIKHIKAHHNQIVEHKYYKIDEIPFDFARRRISVAISHLDQEKHTLISKGAVEEILSICSKAEYNGKIVPINEEIKRKVINLSKKMNREGLRVIAVCYQDFSSDKRSFTAADEKEMVLLGYIGFLDVAKQSAIKAIKSLAEHGVKVKILTGDNEVVTNAICKKIGLEPGAPLLGEQISAMSDEQLGKVAEKTLIFAKVDPMQKARIIAVLKNLGHTVGFMGDGINDAVALKVADVGICVDSGAEIAKESADIILLEKDLAVLEDGVITGRQTFANIIKYIKITLSSNFGNCVSVLIASFWLPFVPMAALQLIFQNLLYDISQIAIPWDRVDKEFTQKPFKWDAKSFVSFSFWNGPLSSIFDVTTFWFMGYVLLAVVNFTPDGANSKYLQDLFHTGWFVLGLISQTVIVHLCRTSKIPVLQSRSTWPLGVMTLVIVVIALALPFTSLGGLLDLVPLPSIYFLYLFVAITTYFVTNQLVKMLYRKIYHRWL